MNKAKRLLALLLAAVLCAMALPVGWAEETEALERLMQGVERPTSYTLTVNPTPAEGSTAQTKIVTVQCQSLDGEAGQAIIALGFEHFNNLDDSWLDRAEAYAEVVRDAAGTGSSIDPEAFAHQLKQDIDTLHQYNQRMAQSELDAKAQEAAKAAQQAREDALANGEPTPTVVPYAPDPLPVASILSIQVTAPYYEVLQRGSRGDGVLKLQQKLIELGFLEGDADGQFGPGTEKGVMALQEHVRTLEQEQIDLLPEPTAIPVDASATPDPESGALPAPIVPEKQKPATEADGIATADLQAFLYSDQFSIASTRLQEGMEGAAVRRLQNRLAYLGYMAEAASGTYGPATSRAVRVFEHYNDWNEDGIATRELQELIYGDTAQRPPYPMLSEGSRGDEVKALQQRLKLLGFMVGDVDGTYGSTTVTGVKNLQQYLYDREVERLTQAAIAERDALYPESTPEPVIEPEIRPEPTPAPQPPTDELPPDPMPNQDFVADDGNEPVVANPMASVKDAFANLFSPKALAEEATFALEGTPVPAATPTPAPTPRPTPRPIDLSQITVVVDGICDPMLQETFYSDAFPAIPGLMKAGAQGVEVKRLQRRLYDLEYFFLSPDGDYGENTSSAVIEFQTRNGLNPDGDAGEQTITKLFSSEAKKALKPFMLKVSISKQRVYAYAPDENEEYTRLVRTMKCSTGLPATPTPKGTFQGGTGPGNRWHYFKKFNCWAQYAYYIEGDILFHSVLYGSKGGRVTQSSVWNLGSRASHGCVRLAVEDAKWVWNNCPRKTKVVVY